MLHKMLKHSSTPVSCEHNQHICRGVYIMKNSEEFSLKDVGMEVLNIIETRC